jgi:hypothetical protein
MKIDPAKFSSVIANKIPVLDINGLGSFQHLHGNEPEMQMQGTRVTLLFNADQKFYELSEKFNRNTPVNVLDFVNAQRQLKAKMFSMKGNIVRDHR